MEVFLKRAERPFKERIGEEKTLSLFENIKKATNEIPTKFRRVIGSDIPKYLFNFSREVEELSPENIEGVLAHVLIFAKSLKDLINKDRTQITQILINRSGNNMRNLLDLLDKFAEKAKQGDIINDELNFEDILTFVVGDKTIITDLNEIELFLKRAEGNFSDKIGKEESHHYIEKIAEKLKKIDNSHKDYLSSDISKILFTFSQSIDKISTDNLKKILHQVVCFTNSLSDLGNKTKDQIDQEIRKRSKNQVHSIIDLCKALIDAANENRIIKLCETLDEILIQLYGEEQKRIQFTDVEAFLKRAEKKYAMILGEDMIHLLMDELLEAINQIPEQHREYLGSDLAKFLFKFSETASFHEPERIELVFNGAIMFAKSLEELSDLNNAEINQFIINRSNHQVRSLFELYKAFLEKIKIRMPLSIEPTFDEILNHTLGRYSGPKVIEKGGLIHDLMADYHEEIPISKEHANWAKALSEIIPRFLEILSNAEGDRILDLLWENKFPENQVIDQYQEKIAEIPREKEKLFMFRLMNMLTNQILIDDEKDKALTGALAFRILGTVFVEIYGGRNTQIRAIRLSSLLKDRKVSNYEKKQGIDDHINRILEEDLKAIQQKTMTINTIIPIITKKGYFIKTYDIVTKDFPELILKLITYREEERLKDIGADYKKSSFAGELIPLVNEFLQKLDLANRFYKKYFEELNKIAFDAQQNMLIIRKFFKLLVELRENLDTIEFYDYKIANTEHSLYILLLKYLYTPLSEVFETTRIILDEQEYQKKIMKLDKYLSKQKLEQLQLDIKFTEQKIREYENFKDFDAYQKIMNLTKFLNRDKNEIKFFEILFKLLDKSEKIHVILKSRFEFSKTLLKYSNSLKKVHSSLPAALSENLANLNEFDQEIDKIISQLKEKSLSGILSPFEFREKNESAEMSKKELLNLYSNEDFTLHIKAIGEISEVTHF
ncbi:MAG: hypothetical protein ACFFB0_12445 [Promethearchaeota archaeon]